MIKSNYKYIGLTNIEKCEINSKISKKLILR